MNINLDAVPLWAFFVGTFLIITVSIEVGYRLGKLAHSRWTDEKESSISAVSGTVLGLVAFILAFTFGIVSNRYDARKELVREEANAVRTTFLRADFLPELDRKDTKALLHEYVDGRLAIIQEGGFPNDHIKQMLVDAERIHRRLWDIAVSNARRDMNSDVAALFIESLNQVIEIHALRLAIGVQTRIPIGIWLVLFSLTILGMTSMGYQIGLAGSHRSVGTTFLGLSFALVFGLIASLDQPMGIIQVTQQPLIDLQSSINERELSPSNLL